MCSRGGCDFGPFSDIGIWCGHIYRWLGFRGYVFDFSRFRSMEGWLTVEVGLFDLQSIPGRRDAHISSLMWCKARGEDDSPLGRLGRLFSAGLDGFVTEWDLHTLQPKVRTHVLFMNLMTCLTHLTLYLKWSYTQHVMYELLLHP